MPLTVTRLRVICAKQSITPRDVQRLSSPLPSLANSGAKRFSICHCRLDKIGHFFAEGWAYFERTRDEGESLAQAMQWGSRQEAGKLGYATTGIYSFADLTANFNGWRFWNEILQSEDDPLQGPTPGLLTGPYVACEFQLLDSLRYRKRIWAWKVRKSFDLADYVDGGAERQWQDPVTRRTQQQLVLAGVRR